MRDVLRLRCALGCVLALLSGALVITADREITFDRLRAADNEPENWLIYAGTYRSLRYSPLDQINAQGRGMLLRGLVDESEVGGKNQLRVRKIRTVGAWVRGRGAVVSVDEQNCVARAVF